MDRPPTSPHLDDLSHEDLSLLSNTLDVLWKAGNLLGDMGYAVRYSLRPGAAPRLTLTNAMVPHAPVDDWRGPALRAEAHAGPDPLAGLDFSPLLAMAHGVPMGRAAAPRAEVPQDAVWQPVVDVPAPAAEPGTAKDPGTPAEPGGPGSRERPRGEIWEGCPVRPLGVNGGTSYFLDVAGQLRAIAKLDRMTIMHLFGNQYAALCKHFPRWGHKDGAPYRLPGEFNGDHAASAMIQAVWEAGLFDPDGAVRGVGAGAGAGGIAPAPEPEPAAEPGPAPAANYGAPWTAEDDRRAIQWRREGLGIEDIAARLGRPFAGVQYRFKPGNKLADWQTRDIDLKPAPAPEPGPAPGPDPEPVPEPVAVDASVPVPGCQQPDLVAADGAQVPVPPAEQVPPGQGPVTLAEAEVRREARANALWSMAGLSSRLREHIVLALIDSMALWRCTAETTVKDMQRITIRWPETTP